MAYAVIGGLTVAALPTLICLPALYVAWFRITPPEAARQQRSRPTAKLAAAPA